MIGSRAAALLLAIAGVLHGGALVALSLSGSARPLSAGDIAFLAGVGTLYFLAAGAVATQRWWGRWLGLAVSGVEAMPAAVLLFTLGVFSADPASEDSLAQFGFMMALLAPLVVFVAMWFHRSPAPER